MFFFSIRVFFHGHWRLIGHQGKGGDHFLFHSTTSTRSRTFRHLFATLHVRWHHIFLIAPLVFTRLLLDEIFTLSNYHLIDWWCEVCFSLFNWWFDTRFLLQQSWYEKTGGLELESTITLLLQANRLTKCASHPKLQKDKIYYLK